MNVGELRESRAECLLQVRSSAQSAGANKFQGFLNVDRGSAGTIPGWNGSHLVVEEQEIEMIFRTERTQDRLHCGVTAFQLLPLHGKRVVKEHNEVFGRSAVAHHRGARPDQGLCLEESRLVVAARGKLLRGVRLG